MMLNEYPKSILPKLVLDELEDYEVAEINRIDDVANFYFLLKMGCGMLTIAFTIMLFIIQGQFLFYAVATSLGGMFISRLQESLYNARLNNHLIDLIVEKGLTKKVKVEWKG